MRTPSRYDAAPFFRLRGLCFGYAPGQELLRGLDFDLHPGERVALVGPNGAGKTSLLHLMLGLLKPSAGTIEAFGAPRRTEKDFHALRGRAGLLFQDSDDQLFCPSLLEDAAFGPLNQGLPPAQARERAMAALAQLGLESLAERPAHSLSGGQKRLAALATVLAMRPEVLLLDEPTNALDPDARERLLSLLADAPQAMVLISHDLDATRRLATRWARLTEGSLTDCPPC